MPFICPEIIETFDYFNWVLTSPGLFQDLGYLLRQLTHHTSCPAPACWACSPAIFFCRMRNADISDPILVAQLLTHLTFCPPKPIPLRFLPIHLLFPTPRLIYHAELLFAFIEYRDQAFPRKKRPAPLTHIILRRFLTQLFRRICWDLQRYENWKDASSGGWRPKLGDTFETGSD